MSELLLGQTVLYKDQYDASLLYPVARAQNRAAIGVRADALPFTGVDIWNGWELSWLNSKGKPVVARGEFRFPARSPNIVESKSFKLYLNSFNGTRFTDIAAVSAIMQRDLSAACGAQVEVQLFADGENGLPQRHRATGICLDTLDIECAQYAVDSDLLAGALTQAAGSPANEISESLYSQLLKSNCPVTGQPDWATVFIDYRGAPIDHEQLLRYLISFRNHAEFHEHCVERIFTDLLLHCRCRELTVYARYTRRGGLDINPWRSTGNGVAPNWIVSRQ